MDLLLFETAYDRIAGDIADLAAQIDIYQMSKDGRIRFNGSAVAEEELSPELAWLSLDLMYHRRVPEFAAIVSSSSALKWVQTANAGLDNPIYRKIAATGTRLSNSDAQALPIAEYVLAHVLHYFQGIEQRLEAQRNIKWRYRPFREVSGSTWLIIGFGNIGERIAARAKPFGATIIGARRSDQGHPLADRMVKQENIMNELPNADVVVLACPLNDATRGIADAHFFQAMKEDSILVNIARGDLIEDEALVAALQAGRPGFAVLDAFSEEPLPKTHPYWKHPNIIVTAHTSNAGSRVLERGDELFVENLRRFLSGDPLRNEVDLAAQFGD